jgi:uroporphyrinogen decarboxylase
VTDAPYSAARRRAVEDAFRARPSRPLVSLWRHWPDEDQHPARLGAAHVHFQRRYDFDFVKFTPSATDVVEDWGVETAFSGDPHGTRDVVGRHLTDAEQWAELRPRDERSSRLYAQLDALRLARAELGPAVPILQTVFSPLTIARKLAGDAVVEHLRRHPESLRAGLETIVADLRRFVERSFDAGADGLFFVTQAATHDLLTDDEHRQFGVPYDLRLLEVARTRTPFLILHAHGSSLMFDQLLGYDLPALNWHDRSVGPSIAQMRARFPGLLLGGIDEWGTLVEGPPRRVRAEVEDALAQAGGRPICLSAGCVIGYRTPDRYIRAARAAVSTD